MCNLVAPLLFEFEATGLYFLLCFGKAGFKGFREKDGKILWSKVLLGKSTQKEGMLKNKILKIQRKTVSLWRENEICLKRLMCLDRKLTNQLRLKKKSTEDGSKIP